MGIDGDGNIGSKATYKLVQGKSEKPGSRCSTVGGPCSLLEKGEIKPYSPVNVIGKIINSDKKILKKLTDGTEATFSLK